MFSTRNSRSRRLAGVGIALLISIPTVSALAPVASTGGTADVFVWDAAKAEHLLNRAGFGAPPEEIAEAVSAGLEATVERLIRGGSGSGKSTPIAEPETMRAGLSAPPTLDSASALLEASARELQGPLLVLDKTFYFDGGQLQMLVELRKYTSNWIARMLHGDDPLRERMTLFWHGHFVSSFIEVANAEYIIRQIEFLRAGALGDFEQLVRGISRDPAMLKYLNNDLNVKTSPNENWARELMELFTLGEGNYTESDVKQAARAFSGWTVDEDEFHFAHEEHDFGPKTVLGVTGNLNGEHVLDILFEQPACSRFIAGKLLEYFEGAAPDETRLNTYSAVLRDKNFQIGEFLQTLFMDEEFYRDEIVGNRIAAPIEYFAGMARRLGISPPPDMLFVIAGLSGQRLLAPPNVKGWEEGFSWLTTSTVMQRSNFAAILLGTYDRQFRPHEVKESMVESLGREFNGPFRDYLAMIAWLQETNWNPDAEGNERLAIPANASDTKRILSLLERLLAVPVNADSAEHLREVIAELLPTPGTDVQSEQFARRLLHVILSLPEAQVL